MRDGRPKEAWLSCPECDSPRIRITTHEGYEASVEFECRVCGEKDGYWL